jgi:hypothetical protein
MSYTVTLTVEEYDALKARIRFLEEIIEEAIFARNCGGAPDLVVFRMEESLLPYSTSGKEVKPMKQGEI